MNEFERQNRAKRVHALVDAIAINQRGFDGLIAESLSRWTPEDWATLARRLGLKSPPSATTIEIVIGIFDDRERRAAQVRAPEERAEAFPF